MVNVLSIVISEFKFAIKFIFGLIPLGKILKNYFPSSLGLLEYTKCFSAERSGPPKSVLFMALTNLMVRFLWCTWLGPIYGLNRTKLHAYAKLNCLNKNYLNKLNCLKEKCFWQIMYLNLNLRTYAKLNSLKWKCLWHWKCTYTKLNFALSAGAVEYTYSFSVMTLKNMVVRFQWCWSFEECGVPFHCHRTQVNSGPEWWHLIGPYVWVK